MPTGINATITAYVHEVEERGNLRTLVCRVPGRKNQEGGYGPTTWLRVKCGRNVELPQLGKGDEVHVQAWANTEEWTDKDGNKRSALCWWGRGVEVVGSDRRQQRPQREPERKPAVAVSEFGPEVGQDDIPF